MTTPTPPNFGSPELRLPDELRGPLLAHLEDLKQKYLARNWGGRVGFGAKPALIVIDFAEHWTKPDGFMGSDVDAVLHDACKVLAAARSAQIPIFFTTYAYDPANPPSPQRPKMCVPIKPGQEARFELDSRLERRPTEKLIRKPYASSFKGTNLHEMLTALGVDTLIVTGISTSHCVYATCRDAVDSFRVIVPREAVGERCELMHLVNLLDIDIDLADVMPLDDVIAHLRGISGTT
jgi:nicotinamidase-related amidase